MAESVRVFAERVPPPVTMWDDNCIKCIILHNAAHSTATSSKASRSTAQSRASCVCARVCVSGEIPVRFHLS